MRAAVGNATLLKRDSWPRQCCPPICPLAPRESGATQVTSSRTQAPAAQPGPSLAPSPQLSYCRVSQFSSITN